MDQSRRKISESQNYQEVSKRKAKNRFIHKSYYNNRNVDWYHYEQPGSEFSAGQWNSQGQRLYPTMSDSAVCGYSFPCDYSVNTAYPMYPVFPTAMYPTEIEYSSRFSRHPRKKNSKYSNETESTTNSNFTSLPPVNVEDVNCSQKRRFSDPGLNNVDESNESTSTSSISEEGCSIVNESLVEQITELKSENKRLFSELESTRDELKTIKAEFATVSSKITCHESFSLAKMVKEIRDAAEIRENVLISKVETLIENCLNSKNMMNFVNEIDSLKKRLSQLEHQLEHLRIHSKVDSKMNGDATEEEIGNISRRKNEAVEKIPKFHKDSDYTKEKDLKLNTKLDLNSDNQDTSTNSLSSVSSESLSSSLGPGSLHSHVTLCGPVTDL